jgi:integration host factor subunit beta
MKTFVKKDVVRIVSNKTGYTHEKVAPIVDGAFKVLTDILAKANPEVRVEIRGFGVLGVKKAKAKPKARNPKTNEVIYVPPHKKVFFKPGKLLTRALQKPLDDQSFAAPATQAVVEPPQEVQAPVFNPGTDS